MYILYVIGIDFFLLFSQANIETMWMSKPPSCPLSMRFWITDLVKKIWNFDYIWDTNSLCSAYNLWLTNLGRVKMRLWTDIWIFSKWSGMKMKKSWPRDLTKSMLTPKVLERCLNVWGRNLIIRRPFHIFYQCFNTAYFYHVSLKTAYKNFTEKFTYLILVLLNSYTAHNEKEVF